PRRAGGRGARAPRAGAHGHGGLPPGRGRRAHDGLRPGRLARPSPGGGRGGLARGLRGPPRLRIPAPREPRQRRGRRGGRAGAAGGGQAWPPAQATEDAGRGCAGAALAARAPDLVLAAEAGREAWGGELPAPASVLKRGPHGIVASEDGRRLELPAPTGPVVDTTGASDALAAGILLGGGLEEAVRRGLGAAGACLARVGAMP